MGIEEEFEQHNNQRTWKSFFDQLQHASFGKHEASARDARRPKFRNRNRYADVSPYDHSRVRLLRNSIDYINASLVVVPKADRSYILTQGPLKDTAGHFWLMVWEQNSQAVVMLNRIIEKEQVKCYQYYPVGQDNEGDDEMIFNDVGLKVSYVAEKHNNYHFTTRVFQLTDLESNESREVLQFHYTAWPDFGVPESPTAFLDFLLAIRDHNVLDDVGRPAVIHCSAGIGRSGTICLVDTCLVLASKNGGDLNGVDVVDVLIEMRQHRMGLIQTADQLRFSYIAILEGAKRLFQDNSSVKIKKSEDTSDALMNELDALNSFDSVIDSIDDSFGNGAEVIQSEPVSAAQAYLESLFKQHDGAINASTGIPAAQSTTDSVAVSTSESLVTDVQSRLERQDSEINDNEEPEDSRGSSKHHVAAINHSTEQSEGKDRKRTREERARNTAENIARIKQRMIESERRRGIKQSYQPYAIAAISAAVALVGYVAYQYLG